MVVLRHSSAVEGLNGFCSSFTILQVISYSCDSLGSLQVDKSLKDLCLVLNSLHELAIVETLLIVGQVAQVRLEVLLGVVQEVIRCGDRRRLRLHAAFL